MAGVLRDGVLPQRCKLPSQELLDDLCSRFVLNAPEEELQSFERILFLVEQAHWFYEDYAMEQNLNLKSFSLKEFTLLMFRSCAALRPYISHFDDIYKDFTTYKTSVPVTGAIILDGSYERCLLVKGWKAGAGWSFPRGKKNKDEEDHSCAIREVLEETGFDVSQLLKPEDYLEIVMGQQRIRLYIICGVTAEDTVFAPQTKKEISEIAWHRIDELPKATSELTSHNRGLTGMKYFMVWPFVRPLKAWITGHAPVGISKNDLSSRGSTVWKAGNTCAMSSGNSFFSGTLSSGSFTPVLPPATGSADMNVPVTNELPGKSFRDFKFDFPEILRGLEPK